MYPTNESLSSDVSQIKRRMFHKNRCGFSMVAPHKQIDKRAGENPDFFDNVHMESQVGCDIFRAEVGHYTITNDNNPLKSLNLQGV